MPCLPHRRFCKGYQLPTEVVDRLADGPPVMCGLTSLRSTDPVKAGAVGKERLPPLRVIRLTLLVRTGTTSRQAELSAPLAPGGLLKRIFGGTKAPEPDSGETCLTTHSKTHPNSPQCGNPPSPPPTAIPQARPTPAKPSPPNPTPLYPTPSPPQPRPAQPRTAYPVTSHPSLPHPALPSPAPPRAWGVGCGAWGVLGFPAAPPLFPTSTHARAHTHTTHPKGKHAP